MPLSLCCSIFKAGEISLDPGQFVGNYIIDDDIEIGITMEFELLRFDNVSYISEGIVSLIDLSFQLQGGDNLVIFGPENSGVNLVSPLIAGLIDSFEGDVYYKGRSIKDFDYNVMLNYRKDLGYIQSNYGLLNNMTVVENIALPLEYHSKLASHEIDQGVNEFVRELNLGHCSNLRPVDLLRSEALKASYARAVALDPDLLILEHALEGQCLLNVQTLLKSVKKRSASRNRSIIFITYEPERFLEFSDRFMMRHHGNVVFDGTRDEFMEAENRYLLQYLKSTVEGPMKIL
jgi:phospholipid/cholesterol/gamma-HCH transport system ATP-binding protein